MYLLTLFEARISPHIDVFFTKTGSGKTYTLGFGFVQGLQSDGSIATDAGLAPRAAAELFRVLKEKVIVLYPVKILLKIMYSLMNMTSCLC